MLYGVVLALSSGACTGSKPTDPVPIPYANEVTDRYAGPTECTDNETGQFVLCSNTPEATPGQPPQLVAFFVYDMTARRVIFEQPPVHGTVAWHDEHTLLLTLTPGIALADDKESAGKTRYLIDIRTGDRRVE